MNIGKLSPKTILSCSVLIILLNVLGNLGSAFFIRQNVIPFESADILVMVTLVVSGMLGCMICCNQSDHPISVYLAGVVVVMFLVLSGFIVYGGNCSVRALSKAAVAVFVGIFIGKFILNCLHNKLRRSRKKRRIYTK